MTQDRIDKAFEGVETYAEAGRRLGLTRERVRQLADAGEIATIDTPVGRFVYLGPRSKGQAERRVRDVLDSFNTYTEAAKALGVTRNAVRHMARVGTLPSIRTPRGPLVRLP